MIFIVLKNAALSNPDLSPHVGIQDTNPNYTATEANRFRYKSFRSLPSEKSNLPVADARSIIIIIIALGV